MVVLGVGVEGVRGLGPGRRDGGRARDHRRHLAADRIVVGVVLALPSPSSRELTDDYRETYTAGR
ncbi:MAG TPA: hypothetical protein VHO06_20155 [Polyangia bacterium]|nr:hypothetical protein [Polyangia bacterium]